MVGPGFCNVGSSGQWNLGSDLDSAVANSINRAIDDKIVPQVTLLRQKAKDLQKMYKDLGTYIVQKMIITGVYIGIFLILSYYLYFAAYGGAFKKIQNAFSSFL
jgi:hypothetical protein